LHDAYRIATVETTMTEMTIVQVLNTLTFKELAAMHKHYGGGFDFNRGPSGHPNWGKSAAIEYLMQRHTEQSLRDVAFTVTQNAQQPKVVTPETKTMTTPDQQAAVQNLLNTFGISTGPDEARIREIVAEAIASVEPTKVEYHVKRFDGSTVKVDGHVRPEFKTILRDAAAGVNILLVGPAGCGKTHIAKQCAKALDRPFASVSCTAGMSEAAFKGRQLPVDNGNFRYIESDFVRLYRNGGIFLIDEADALDGNVAMTLNNALAGDGFNNELIMGDTWVPRHPDFVCIAAANTFGTGANAIYAGRERLDGAFLDRFLAGRIALDYDRELERLAVDGRLLKWGWDVRKNITDNRIHKVLSTRFLIDATKLLTVGATHSEMVDRFFADWKSDDRQRVDVAV
jgi:cobaltochelatase CobS